MAAQRIFFGWRVVAGALGVMFFGFGCAYSFGAFFDILQGEFAATRGEVSLVFSIAGFLYFSLGVLSGGLADRIGPRPVVVAGMLIVGAGFVAAGFATALWQVYLAYGLGVGIGIGFAYVPSIGAVQPWFVRRRGLASGIAVAGIGLGTLLMPPFAAFLIEIGGWRHAYLVLGLLAIVCGGGLGLLVENSPERRGLLPDGDASDPGAGVAGGRTVPAGGADGSVWRVAVKTPAFRRLYAGVFLVSLGLFVPFVHLVPYAMDRGVGRAEAVGLFGLIGLGSTLGRFALGGLADRLGRRASLALMCAGMALALLWWLLAVGDDAALILGAFAIAFGVCYGGFVALLPALAADYFHFGSRGLGAIIGALYTSVAFGTLVGPPLAGLAFDVSGSYGWPIGLSAMGCLAGVVLVASMPPAPGFLPAAPPPPLGRTG